MAELIQAGRNTLRSEMDYLLTHCASFEAFAAVMFHVEVFWIVTPCSIVVGYQRFRGPCCLHPQGSMDLWNVGILLLQYMVSQPRGPRLEIFSNSFVL